MSSQSHGKRLEDILKASLFPGSADHGRSATAKVDVEARFDKRLGLGTSVKASKECGVVALADARSFWSIDFPFRLMVGCWRQVGTSHKEFYEVREFIVHGGMMDWLRVGVSLGDVASLHESIQPSRFPIGEHAAARAWAKSEQARLYLVGTRLGLNYKIDSKRQRRLQSSVPMATLLEMAFKFPQFRPDAPNYTAHSEEVGELALPFRVKSSSRTA